MYVKDHMTKEPYCITADLVVSKALDIMGKNHFHRLPVVDEKHRLIGLVTEGLVSEKTAAKTTSLSIYELNYLLSRTQVKDIMITEIKTIGPDDAIEEAARLMRSNHINVLPVVDENQLVVGIITSNDLFDAMLDLLGYAKFGTRFVIKLEDKSGNLAKFAELFAQESVNVENLAVYHTERGVEVVIVTSTVCPEMKDVLTGAGFTVSDVKVQDKN